MVDFATRFWSKVDTSAGPDACWPWTGKTAGSVRRGQLVMKQPDGSWRYEYAPRVSLQIDRGAALAPSEHACHTCDNPLCVNPRHLFVSDRRGNLADCARKLRAAPNTRKLSPDDVQDIRRRRLSGEPRHVLAREYGVDGNTIYSLMVGKSWAWLEPPDIQPDSSSLCT